MADDKDSRIILAHGGGGRLTNELIGSFILPKISSADVSALTDSARLNFESGSFFFTTDSYVVKPLFFNGGDIGKLAVCGTVNDLAVAGARPRALSLSLIIETGFQMSVLEKILESIGQTARDNRVSIVTGDTKTVESGAVDGIFINTAGVGEAIEGVKLAFDRISAGDKIIINGTIGDHGMTVISQREGMQFQSELKSDCAGLAGLTCKLLEKVEGIKFMRDLTRGGLAATLNEIVQGTGCSVEIFQDNIPINPTVQAAADMLGFDVLNIANEGKFAAVVSPEAAKEYLRICRAHRLAGRAGIIGTITAETPAIVEMVTEIGGRRVVPMPYGRELPRIC